ncbi:MAG: LysM peptidoglycan-binding domain-containing protein [Deltaproteobacteria bacterium]|nr:LysM peptidoglycan-binding domain-containing protein [Deltaproteobacteria bacterium]
MSQNSSHLESEDSQLTSTELENNILLAEDGNPAEDESATIDNASEEARIASEIAASCEPGQNGDKNPDGNISSPKKAQPVLDDALELCQLSQEFWQKGELENAVEALDQAYALILHVDITDQPKLIQQKEDLRFMISKRILEIYASRNIVVNGNHNAIPLVINSHIQAEINLFTRGERNFFRSSYQRSGRYRPQIVAALREAGLPEELSWLPLIESGYKVNALSRSRALGPWQFIPSTGYKFGLKRDKFIDERMDPVKSTRAAIAYLKELHGIFGDWSTVLAAYNCGEGKVLRVIRNQNLNYLDNFWDLYERLPRETARYVPRFLATLHIVNNPVKYGIDDIIVDPPLESERVTISKQVHLRDVARSIGVSEAKLKELNPELRYKIVPGDGYPLRVPLGHSNILLANLDKIPVSHPPQRAFVYHRVRRGETLSVIAKKYRTSVSSLMRANQLRRSNFIVAGKLLKIPQRGYIYKKPKPVRPKSGEAVSHIVRKGDSLWIIAKQYGTTTKNIQELNRLSSTDLYKGQTLTIFPAKGKKKPIDKTGMNTYQVRSGDSPFLIARRHNMTLERFLSINDLWHGSTIYPGQIVYIE